MPQHFASGILEDPAPRAAIDALVQYAGFDLPDEYIGFLRRHDGGEGPLEDRDIMLWKAEDLVALNRDYQVARYAPGIFLFGSDGGGELLAFDLQDPRRSVVLIPAIGMSRRDAMPVSDDIATIGDLLAELMRLIDDDRNRREGRRGMELFDILPVIAGGDPSNPRNKTWLTRRQHIEAVGYWNRVIRDPRYRKH
jgi:hypothetical protein